MRTWNRCSENGNGNKKTAEQTDRQADTYEKKAEENRTEKIRTGKMEKTFFRHGLSVFVEGVAERYACTCLIVLNCFRTLQNRQKPNRAERLSDAECGG